MNMDAIVDVSNVVLETERLILRAWKKEDLNDIYEYARVEEYNAPTCQDNFLAFLS